VNNGNAEPNHADPASRQPSPIAVIIPTYNRVSALLNCLKHLEEQTCKDFEVIIVDDGSTDDTVAIMQRYLATTPLRVQLRRQQNAGPAKARNLAISLVQSPVCLIIGDDIFGSPDFVATHLRFHRQHPGEECAAVGLTRWSETGQIVTPFMRWLDEGGIQFSYHDLLRGVQPCWKHFYTSNLSLKTTLLRENPFEEAFTRDRWMMEDLELGYRLEKLRGMKLSFLPEALAEHLHPTTFRRTCERAFAIGVSRSVFERLWPEHRSAPTARPRRAVAAVARWLLPALSLLTEAVTRWWCPNPLLRPVLRLHASLGYRSSGPPEPVG
jgi:glycosyltransferase involved in cell wall biosynthesis